MEEVIRRLGYEHVFDRLERVGVTANGSVDPWRQFRACGKLKRQMEKNR
jgi:hypothetical protein